MHPVVKRIHFKNLLLWHFRPKLRDLCGMVREQVQVKEKRAKRLANLSTELWRRRSSFSSGSYGECVRRLVPNTLRLMTTEKCATKFIFPVS